MLYRTLPQHQDCLHVRLDQNVDLAEDATRLKLFKELVHHIATHKPGVVAIDFKFCRKLDTGLLRLIISLQKKCSRLACQLCFCNLDLGLEDELMTLPFFKKTRCFEDLPDLVNSLREANPPVTQHSSSDES